MLEKLIWAMGLGLCLLGLVIGISYGEQALVARKVAQAPVIDGRATEAVWGQAQEITTHDKVADIDITLKAVYTDKQIFFMVTFPDKNESRTHRSWVWNSKEKEYEQGKDREDVLVIKWNMYSQPLDLSVYADNPYLADIWFWKAQRTDPLGYADDKLQRLSPHLLERANELVSQSGKKMYLQRLGDQGDAAYKTDIYIDYMGDILPRFSPKQPTGSRADIRAKGGWQAGWWTIEFGRALFTGHSDDIQLDPKQVYQFGVSRHEIAGRQLEPEATQPLYGCGDVSERLILKFGQ